MHVARLPFLRQVQQDRLFVRASNVAVEYAGILALLVYALFWLPLEDVSGAAEVVLIGLFFWTLWRDPRRELLRSPLVLIALGWISYQLLFVPFVIREFPELLAGQIEYALHYAKLALIPMVAWWLGGAVRTVALMFGLAALGFILGVTFQADGVLDSIHSIGKHKRLGLGYRNWEHVAVYAGFALLILTGLWRQLAGWFGRHQRFGHTCVAAGIIYCLWLVMITQTRAVWLGLSFAALVAGIAALLVRRTDRSGHRDDRESRRGAIWLLAGALGVVVALMGVLDIPELVERRLAQEQHVVDMIVAGELDEVPLTSIGIRIVSWRQALEWIAERPLLGWGPKTRYHLFENGELPSIIPGRHRIHHFHNQYIETSIAYGLIGVLVYTAVLVLVIHAAWRAWRDGLMPRNVLLFGIAALAFWSTVNMFESYFNYSTGTYINALLGGAFYTYRFARRT